MEIVKDRRGASAPYYSVNVQPPQSHLLKDPIWRAEFRGLFWGEGWLGINRFKQRQNGRDRWTYRAEMMLSQAQDNVDMVYHLRDVLGGWVYVRETRKSNKQTTYCWQARSQVVTRRGIDVLLEPGFLPDKKVAKVAAIDEFLKLIQSAPKPFSPETHHRFEQLRAISTPNGKDLRNI